MTLLINYKIGTTIVLILPEKMKNSESLSNLCKVTQPLSEECLLEPEPLRLKVRQGFWKDFVPRDVLALRFRSKFRIIAHVRRSMCGAGIYDVASVKCHKLPEDGTKLSGIRSLPSSQELTRLTTVLGLFYISPFKSFFYAPDIIEM